MDFFNRGLFPAHSPPLPPGRVGEPRKLTAESRGAPPVCVAPPSTKQVAPLAPTRHASILRRYRDKALQPLQWDQIFSGKTESRAVFDW